MFNITNRHQFLIITIFLGIILWLTDSLVHHFFFGQELKIIPDEANELWMRGTIVSLLILFGTYIDYHHKSVLTHEKEKLIIYQATIHSTQHILNNLLNQMQLLRMEIDSPGKYKDELTATFEECFSEGKELVQRLSSVDTLTAEDIMNSVNPEYINN